MDSFAPKNFFDLSTTVHGALFEGCRFVWEVLGNIRAYLLSKPFAMPALPDMSRSYLVHPERISIGEGSVIEPGAYIEGPCIIGKGCRIRCGTYVRGDVLIDDGCVVRSELKNCILLHNAKAAHLSYVADSIVGSDVNLGAGSVLANLRLDGKSIVVRCGEQRVDTGLRKLGAIIGDGSSIGCNVVINPGTLILKGVQCYPTLNIGGYISEKSVMRPERSRSR